MSGYILVAGGTARKADPVATDDLFVYDVARDQWVRREPMPTPRAAAGCALHDGHLYVFGGKTTGGEVVDAVERYAVADDEWETLAPMPTPRARLSRLYRTHDGTVYVAGGYDGERRLPANEAYSLDADEWDTSVAEMPVSQTFPVLFEHAGSLWHVTGNSDDVAGGHVQRYDPDVDGWEGPGAFAAHPEHVTDGHGIAVDGEAHFMGGWPTAGEGSRSRSHWRYHFDADRWDLVDSMPERWSHGSTLWDGQHLWRVLGSTAAPPGEATRHVTERLLRWDPRTGAYEERQGAPEGRMNFSAAYTTTTPPGL